MTGTIGTVLNSGSVTVARGLAVLHPCIGNASLNVIAHDSVNRLNPSYTPQRSRVAHRSIDGCQDRYFDVCLQKETLSPPGNRSSGGG